MPTNDRRNAEPTPRQLLLLLLFFVGMIALGSAVFVAGFDTPLMHAGFLGCTLGFLVMVVRAASARMHHEASKR